MCGIKYKDCEYCLQQTSVKHYLILYKCLCCNTNYQRNFDEKFKRWFANTYNFSNHYTNKFILLLQKGVYALEYMNDWDQLNETKLTGKEDIYSQLKMEDIIDGDYTHAKRVCKDFEMKKLGEYYNFHVQRNTILLVDVFNNLRNMSVVNNLKYQ